jgi:thioesterase domain-containing protein/acyl carrier protein
MLPAILRGLVRAPARRTETGVPLSQRLAGVPEPDRAPVVLDLVQAQVAAVLGHDSAASVDPDRGFKELGVDSLAAVELRNRLTQTSGVRLPSTLVFDHPSPAAIARLLLTEIDVTSAPRNGQTNGNGHANGHANGNGYANGNGNGRANGYANGGGRTNGHANGDGHGTLSTLLRNAHARGSIAEALPLLTEASRFRPAFASPDELGDADGFVVQLASGGGLPKLVCVPSFVVGSGPHQFMRFADRFEGRRDVFACSLPGFRGTEPAPGCWSAAVEVLEASIRKAVGDEPFILVGYSIGGVVAHSLAARFESTGRAPAGLVLIDTPTPEDEKENNRVFSMVMTEILENEHEAIAIDDANWLAMGTYLRLLGERGAACLTAPTLMIRASEPLSTGDGDTCWPSWEVSDEQVEVAGHHFALIEAEAAATADATEKWLES